MDILASGPDPDFDETQHDETEPTWGHPGTLGLTSLVLAVLVILNIGLLRGTGYVAIFIKDNEELLGTGSGGAHGVLIAGAFLSAAFALVPLLLARTALQRLVPSDGLWTGHLVRTALMLSAAAFVLRLILALMSLGPNPNVFSSFFYG